MSQAPIHVLFLSTANSARSLIGEVLLRDFGGGRVRSFSAGIQPEGQMMPEVQNYLEAKGYETAGLFSKTHRLYMEDGAPHIDLVISISDETENQPVLGPLGALRVHWRLPSILRIEDKSQQRTLIKASYKAMEDSICQALQPSWSGLSVGDLRGVFERVAPQDIKANNPTFSLPESYLLDFTPPDMAFA